MKNVLILLSFVGLMGMMSCRGFYSNMGVTTAKCEKEGIAKKTVWLGMAFNVDVSIETAAKNGGITKISSVDYLVKRGFLNKTYVTKVCGE